MANRFRWEIVAAVELQRTLDRLVAGDYESPRELEKSLKQSQKQWEDLASVESIELSGITFPVDRVDQS